MYFSSNLRFLRKRRRKSQEAVALALNMNRSTLNNYEHDISGPPVKTLIMLADYFRIAVDTLLRVDLSSLRESQLSELERGQDVFLKGSRIRVLATTVDSHNKENIELVAVKAKAGYLNGYSDPEYISELPVFQLPFLSAGKKYRTFQISGDSMLPIPDGAWVTGEFVQNWFEVRSGEKYVILTKNEGIVFKEVKNLIREEGCLDMISVNTSYDSYKLNIDDVMEIWKFVHYISVEIPASDSSVCLSAGIETIMNDLATIKRYIMSGRE